MLTRFAPAPTGFLHLGHVLNAEYVWGAAAGGGRVLLRIEDHDRERCRPEYERAILDDLDWLGYRPDVHPTSEFRAGRCDGLQSDRGAAYHRAFERLRAQGLVYACDCTRAAIDARTRVRAAPARTPGPSLMREMRYDGFCRDRGLPLADDVGWRVRMAPGVERFVDERVGLQDQDPASQAGDVLIRDRHGNWTYQLCVTVDDFEQGITHVIRGMDLLPSTGRQIRLARMLGRATPPTFLHHPLIMKTPAQKLSKSDRDTAVRDLRARGLAPDDIRRLAREALDGSR